MKKRFILLSIVLCLVLLVATPGVALAKGKAPALPKALTEFTAEMTVTEIDDTIIGGNVFPILDQYGNLVGWQVVGRQVRGEVSGDLEGTFVVTYNATLALNQQGLIEGTLEIDTKPGSKRGIIFGTLSGMTAVVGEGFDPVKMLPYFDMMFVADQLEFVGGTGIYRRIEGEGGFAAGYTNPIRVYLDPLNPQHVIDVEGSMTLQGTYTRVAKPTRGGPKH